jgi:hypothetical protein
MRRISSAWVSSSLVCTSILILVGCRESDGPPAQSSAAVRQDGAPARIHRNGEHDFQLEVPALPWVVRWRRYRADSPAHKLKGTLRLVWQGRTGVSLDVWIRPGREPVSDWFDRVLRGAVSREATRTQILATRHRVATLRFAEPRSPQAPARRQAVFALESRVYRLVCHDADEPAFRRAFERALATFRQEASP